MVSSTARDRFRRITAVASYFLQIPNDIIIFNSNHSAFIPEHVREWSLMRLLLNKLRLTISAELKPDDDSDSIQQSLARAEKTLDKLTATGRVQRFYFTDLIKFAKKQVQGSGERIKFILAVGIPNTEQVQIKKPSIIDRVRRYVCRLTIEPECYLADTRYTFAVCALIADVTRYDLALIDEEAVYEALKKAKTSAEPMIFRIPLYRPRLWKKLLDLAEGVSLHRSRVGELALHIEDPEYLTDHNEGFLLAESNLQSALVDNVTSLSLTDVSTIMGRFHSLMRRLPSHARHRAKGPGARWVIWHKEDVAGRKGRNKDRAPRTVEVSVEISADCMQCFMTVKPLVPKGASVSRDELLALLRLEKIHEPFLDELIEIQNSVAAGEVVEARLVAAGRLAKPPKEPKLRLAIVAETDKPVKQKEFLERSNTDLRQLQPKRFVGEGEIVAVIEFATAGVEGCDVLGQPIPFRIENTEGFVAGAGVERRGQLFYSKVSGTLRINGSEIIVEPATEIAGNVDFTTGDIHVRVGLVISGSVEMGASVTAGGAMTIGQAFAGKYLRANSGLIIMGGVQAQRGSVLFVVGDATVKFMQGGILRCRGNVIIESNMTGGIIEATGSVTVLEPQGGIFGGQVIAGENVIASNVGRENGSNLQIWFGSVVHAVRRRTLLKKRRADLMLRYEALDRSGIGGDGKLTERAIKRGDRGAVRETMGRIIAIIKRIDEQLEKLVSSTSQSKEYYLEAKGTLARGTSIWRDNQLLSIDTSVIGTQVRQGNSGLTLVALAEDHAKKAT